VPKKILKDLHESPIKLLEFNHKYNFTISIDDSGMIEFWSPSDFSFPEHIVKFEMISDTDYFSLLEAETPVASCLNNA